MDLVCPNIIVEQSFESGKVVSHTVIAAVQQADPNSNSFEQPLRQRVVIMVKDVLVDDHVAAHCMGPEAVGHHDVIDIVVRALDSVVQRAQGAGRCVVRDGVDPGHILSSISNSPGPLWNRFKVYSKSVASGQGGWLG